jgi:cytochrome c-type biogenesis protein CcmH
VADAARRVTPGLAPSSPAAPRVFRTGSRQWWRRPWLQIAALLVVLVAALVVGSGAGSGHETAAARAAAIDAQVRCPSCEDISVAQSTDSAAIAVRHEVSRMVAQGKSDQQIEDTLVSQYGPTILLRPPTSGLSALVWIVPVVAGAGALIALVALFWRRGRALRQLRRSAR